jgi:DNA-binding winged helix-turn-helix (wHTH) protein
MVFVFGEFEADELLCELRERGRTVHVEPRPFDLLVYLIRERGRTVPKEELLRVVWRGLAVSESSLSTCVNSLRNALGVPKGRADPIETVRGRGYRFRAAVEERAAPPERSARASEPFVGRHAIVEALVGALTDAQAGRGRVYLLVGEAGIGKTATAELLLAEARQRGHAAVWAGCPETRDGPPFWPWIGLLRPLAAGLDGATLARRLGGDVGELAALLPELDARAERAPGARPKPDRFRLLDAAGRLLAAGAEAGPVTLVLDDLHRADSASLALLEHAAREARHLRLLLVGTLRGGGEALAPEIQRVLDEISRLPHAERIELGGLGADDVRTYVEAVTGTAPSREAAEVLRERTDGNPLFLRELVRSVDPNALGAGEPATPRSLRELIGLRLHGLSPQALELLRIASVAGRESELPVLARAAPLATAALLDAVDEAIAAGVVVEVRGTPERLRFSHALVRDAVYEALPLGERTRFHERMALALEDVPDEARELRTSELARHWRAAAPRGHAGRARAWCLRAAELARSRTAHAEAAQELEHAVAMLRLEPQRDSAAELDLLLDIGTAWLLAGDPQRTRESFADAAEAARVQKRPELLVRAALGFGGSALWGNAPEARERRLLEEAERALGEGPPALRAQLLARLVTIRSYGGDLEEQAAPARRALALARTSGEPEALGEALHALHFVLRGPDHLAERETLALELLGLDLRAQHTFAIREALAADRLSRGDRAGSAEMLAEADRVAGASHHPVLRWLATANLASAALLEGRLTDAETGMAAAADLGRRVRNPQAIPLAFGQQLALRRERGSLAELEAAYESIAPKLDWIGRLPGVMLAVLRCERDRLDAARPLFEALVDEGVEGARRREDWLIATTELAGVCASLGDRSRAALLHRALLPYRERVAVLPGTLLSAGPVSHALGRLARLLGRNDEAASHLEHAFDLAERTGARPARLRVAADLAALWQASSRSADRERGRKLASEAHADASAIGMRLRP